MSEMKVITFKADDDYFRRIESVKKTLNTDNSSEIIRIAINELFDKVCDPKRKPGDHVICGGNEYRFITQNMEQFNEVMTGLENELSKLKESNKVIFDTMKRLLK